MFKSKILPAFLSVLALFWLWTVPGSAFEGGGWQEPRGPGRALCGARGLSGRTQGRSHRWSSTNRGDL